MIEKMVDVVTADGSMDAFMVHPEEGGPFPSVIVLMDIWGLREELYDTARRIASTGYHCILPNFWYRKGKVRFEYRDAKGKMRSMIDLPQAAQDEIRDNARLVTDRMAVADIGSVMGFLDGQPAARKGPKGSMGYCLGGRLSLAAAAEFPDVFRASAALHGTTMVTDAPDSPHRFTGRMRGEVYCGFAEKDQWAPPSTIETLAKNFKENKDVRYRAIVHTGTVHGYSLPDRDIFNKASTNRDWENIFAMFKRELS